MRQHKVRQEDIARVVGVSISTVSRVLSGAPGISPTTTKKVLQAAADLGTPLPHVHHTQPPAQGHGLKRALLFLNQVDINSGSGSIYHFVMTGIQKAAQRIGLPVELALQSEDGEIPDQFLDRADTGILFAGVDPSASLSKKLKNKGLATVFVNGLDPDMIHDQVAPNNFYGGRLAARHLVGMGHRRILHFGTKRRGTLRARTEGFRNGIENAGVGGIEYDYVELGNVTEIDAGTALRELLKDGQFPFSAVFCSADNVALTALQALRLRGIDVPRDVSLLGFNGLPVAELSSPLLSTLAVDWEFLGTEAIRLLALRSLEPDRPAQQTLTQVILKQRDTVLDVN
ncbi:MULTISPECIES: LacI family DNA-binding transcriptional regulator [unclassified Meridianimarinicoccus]|uniref:LacI family DNA-binding transcriptional regulator n=1 Tax=unclassified Meridianimarinicoccus TaxID=2923344 RepID=UPI0018691294|nr:LacI family DNA-binding transcriptional regulator [Fluviibacterium sp. MJW13]